MSRMQLALNVDDLDQAVEFYSKLFNVAPAKRKPGYANFAVAKPPLKLVLLENPGQGGTINHLGVEVESSDRVLVRVIWAGISPVATRVMNAVRSILSRGGRTSPVNGCTRSVIATLRGSSQFGV